MGRVPAVTTSHRRHAHADTTALVNFITASKDEMLVMSWDAPSYLCAGLEVSVARSQMPCNALFLFQRLW